MARAQIAPDAITENAGAEMALKNSSNYEPWEDEVLHDVYSNRDDYAAQHGYDLDRIYADLKQREADSLLRKFADRHL